MDMKIFKHVPYSIKYMKVNLDHYTYMRKNGDIPPQITISLMYWLHDCLLNKRKQGCHADVFGRTDRRMIGRWSRGHL
jgi:hypothetical protein